MQRVHVYVHVSDPACLLQRTVDSRLVAGCRMSDQAGSTK